ncbi:MAG: TIM44-like domain-containing protein [Clostridia bacterium]|nr:TIM44-like domain-containing protein [Clostridia bacterium]
MINISDYDKSFTESTFKSKVDNMFVMLYTSIMLQDLTRVDHYIGDDLYKKYENKIKKLMESNQRQMYDELNVKSTEILNAEVEDDKIIIKVLIVSRYLDYTIDKSTGRMVAGNRDSRVQRNNYLTLEKKINAHELGISRKCPSCGANMDINYSGKCEYCGSIFNTEEYDYVITKLDEDYVDAMRGVR